MVFDPVNFSHVHNHIANCIKQAGWIQLVIEVITNNRN